MRRQRNGRGYEVEDVVHLRVPWPNPDPDRRESNPVPQLLAMPSEVGSVLAPEVAEGARKGLDRHVDSHVIGES